MTSLDGPGFGETASSLTFQDPDEEDEVGIDTQADDFRFDFTIPSQNFGANFVTGLASQSNQFPDSKVSRKFLCALCTLKKLWRNSMWQWKMNFITARSKSWFGLGRFVQRFDRRFTK